jgi:hypothetical protein
VEPVPGGSSRKARSSLMEPFALTVDIMSPVCSSPFILNPYRRTDSTAIV